MTLASWSLFATVWGCVKLRSWAWSMRRRM
jgi:hypothetical protein